MVSFTTGHLARAARFADYLFPVTGYGNLFTAICWTTSSAALLFYILTIAAVVVLRYRRPDANRLCLRFTCWAPPW
jgi:hypothetical protein